MTVEDRLSAALEGRYRIERELGAGGMATVYLAQDLKHDRKVALKVLKPELAAVIGAERFLAEIKTTANLQHPHILALFDSGQVDGTVFYVMPFVAGESLRDRIGREKQLPIDDAVRIAREVGDALGHAHGLGVIHRDIKPENILLQGGHALVADFGIALAAAKTGGTRMTETGMSLGTPRYMSPEQAMGERELDARADIYALGCVLYEMLTGEPPFTGTTAQSIVAKVLTEKPAPIIPRRDRVPPHVEDAVLTALEKLPADRFATAAEFVAALAAGGARAGTTSARARPRSAAIPHGRQRQLLVAGATVTALAAAGGWLIGRGSVEPTPATASALSLVEPGSSIGYNATLQRAIDISADGQLIVFQASEGSGAYRAMTRRLDATTSRAVPGSEGASQLHLSPDGRTLYANLGGGVMQRRTLAGGQWTPIPGLTPTAFLAFGRDSVLWWAENVGFGSRRRLPDGRDSAFFPRSLVGQVLPDGKHAVGVAFTTASNSGEAQLMDLETGKVTTLIDFPVVEARYTMGYLVYVRPDNVLAAMPFDVRTKRVTDAPVDLATDVLVSSTGFAQFAVSDNGTVVFIPGYDSDLVRVSRDGATRVLLERRRRYHSPRIAPDGQRIAFDAFGVDGRDVWLYTGASEPERTTMQRDGHDPVWSRDGRALYYLAGRDRRLDVFRTLPGTSTQPQAESTFVEPSYTGTPLADGSGFLTTMTGGSGLGMDIVRLTSRGTDVQKILATTADETYPVPSPDGRWFAYVSNQAGAPQVYVRPLAGGDVPLQVSLDGGTEPVWSRDGRELFYRRGSPKGSELIAATLQLAGAARVLTRSSLFDVSNYEAAEPHANYDVSPDGRWFVFARRSEATQIVVLQNVPELARRAARAAAVAR